MQSKKSEIFVLNEITPQLSVDNKQHLATHQSLHRSQTQGALLELSADALINECREGNISNVREILRSNFSGMGELSSADNQLTVKSVGRRFNPQRLDLETRDDMGHTSLNISARFNHQDICLLLLEYGSKVNTVDKDGWTPLMNASKYGNLNLVKAFLEKRAHLEDRDLGGFTALMWAVYKNHLETVKILLKAGADPNVKCKVLFSYFMIRFWYFSKSKTEKNSICCLSWASGRGYYEVVCELLKSPHINVNSQDQVYKILFTLTHSYINLIYKLKYFNFIHRMVRAQFCG